MSQTLNARVASVLKSYLNNGPAMLAIIVACTEHALTHKDTRLLLKIGAATHGTKDFAIVTGIVGKLSDDTLRIGEIKGKGLSVTISKKRGPVKDAEAFTTAKRAVATNTTFRSKEFLEKMGLGAGQKQDFDLAKRMASLVKKACEEEKMTTLADLEKALRAAWKVQVEAESESEKKNAPSPTRGLGSIKANPGLTGPVKAMPKAKGKATHATTPVAN